MIQKDDWGYDPYIGENLSEKEKNMMGIGVVAAHLVETFGKYPIKEFLIAIGKSVSPEIDDNEAYQRVIMY